MELEIRRRNESETLLSLPFLSLCQDIRRLMALAHPRTTDSMKETIACDYFRDSLDNSEVALKVHERDPASMDDA